jgi:hypothetical protein
MAIIRYAIFERNLIKLCFQYNELDNYRQSIDTEYVSEYCMRYFDFSEMIPYVVQTRTCGLEHLSKVTDYKWEEGLKQKQAVAYTKYRVPKKTVYDIDFSASRPTEGFVYFSIEPLFADSVNEIYDNVGYGQLLLLLNKESDNKSTFDDITQAFVNCQHEMDLDGNLYYCNLYNRLVSKYRDIYCLHYSMHGGGAIRQHLNGKVKFNETLPIYSFDIYSQGLGT